MINIDSAVCGVYQCQMIVSFISFTYVGIQIHQNCMNKRIGYVFSVHRVGF